ncbi:MAG TPA: hypothetical protein VI731_05440, partial [Bacteroidia bacterium]|nr:hypothetical protein [Bacteroidia bacterium]
MRPRHILSLLFVLLFVQASGQTPVAWREKMILPSGDTIQLDTLSIIPSTFTLYNGQTKLDTTDYELLPAESRLILKPGAPRDSLRVRYVVYPVLFTKTYTHKDQERFTSKPDNRTNPFLYRPGDEKADDPFGTGALTKSGSLSRGIVFGNNRDVSVNSSLNLQMSGKLTENLDLTMAATDDNLPVQPDGTTQQLQEFDRVYIQLSGNGMKMIAGDFYVTRPNSYFMNFNKRGQGVNASYLTPLGGTKDKPGQLNVSGAIAISKGKFSRNILQGVEGNQGPYRLHGAENELFIVVLSGTEKVYIDGRLLIRGQENDYIIDYNTAQVTFTARQLITKDKRIEVEFQYADRNYARSMIYTGLDYRREGWQTWFHAFSEQDNKNQPLQQTLTSENKLRMAEVGDSLYKAVVPGVDSVAFSGDLVLYKKIDTLAGSVLYNDVYVYSTNPDSAHYRLSFSYTGLYGGNYIQVSSSANGKTFRWIAPQNGIPQGDHEPVILLITPKRKQMVVLGTKKEMRFGLLNSEFAYTRNDLNTFSPFNSTDDHGYGGKLNIESGYAVSDSLSLVVETHYELVSRYFSPIERYRSVEFERDWNLGWGSANRLPASGQHLGGVTLNLKKLKSANRISYGWSMFREGEFMNGVKNDVAGSWNYRRFGAVAHVSLLQTSGQNRNTTFLRHTAT